MRLVACGTCDRHILDREAACPFCGAVRPFPDSHVQHRGGLGALALASVCAGMLVACAPAGGEPAGEGGTTGSPMAATDGAGTTSDPATGPVMTTSVTTTSPPDPGDSTGIPPGMTQGQDATDDDTSDWDDDGDNPCGFYAGCSPDVGDYDPFECDLAAQDCPEGEKCMPWADDGGSQWTATRCSPIDNTPGQLADACTVEGSFVSGIDDCDIGLMCFFIDPATNAGECVALCDGEGLGCEDPSAQCDPMTDVLSVCVEPCNPLLFDCGGDDGCFPVGDSFACVDAMGAAGQGETCGTSYACAPGHACVEAAALDGCEPGSEAGCCTTLCDLEAPTCPGDTACAAWYPEDAPEGYEALGVCLSG